jgi:hypothetical protein
LRLTDDGKPATRNAALLAARSCPSTLPSGLRGCFG